MRARGAGARCGPGPRGEPSRPQVRPTLRPPRRATSAAAAVLAATAATAALAVLACPGTAPVASAAVLRVQPDGRGPYPHLAAALAAARDGDVVELAPGVYRGPGNRDLDFAGKAVTVRSRDGDAAGCVIDCRDGDGAPHRGFLAQNGEGSATRLVGLTVRGGHAAGERPPAGSGGAFYCRGSSPTLEGCVFVGNRGAMGGALACEFSAAPRVVRCLFRQNTALNGGGAHVFASTPSFEACEFLGNTANAGGALSCYAGSPRLDRCRLVGNAANNGGAVTCEMEAAPVLVACMLARNWATLGGGLHAAGAFPALERCTLAANGAGAGGGACGRAGAAIRLVSCVVAHGPQGEAVACTDGSRAVVSCSLIWGNGDGDWVGCLAEQEGADGNQAVDPGWRDPGGGDYRPAAGAPARGVGCPPWGAPPELCAPGRDDGP